MLCAISLFISYKSSCQIFWVFWLKTRSRKVEVHLPLSVNLLSHLKVSHFHEESRYSYSPCAWCQTKNARTDICFHMDRRKLYDIKYKFWFCNLKGDGLSWLIRVYREQRSINPGIYIFHWFPSFYTSQSFSSFDTIWRSYLFPIHSWSSSLAS